MVGPHRQVRRDDPDGAEAGRDVAGDRAARFDSRWRGQPVDTALTDAAACQQRVAVLPATPVDRRTEMGVHPQPVAQFGDLIGVARPGAVVAIDLL
nr:hypothetical protein [Stackebrandtia endophytica]